MKKLFVMVLGYALLLLSINPVMAQQMRALSGVVIVDSHEYKQGTVIIRFDDFPKLNAGSKGRIDDPTIVGGVGNFQTPPAIIVHLREWSDQDNANGDNKTKNYIISSESFSDRLHINWEVSDDTEVYEIGFLVVGEAVQ